MRQEVTMKTILSGLLVLSLGLLAPSRAFCAGTQEADASASAEADASAGEAGDEAWLEGKEKSDIPPPAKKRNESLEEDPKKWYFGIGGVLRMHIIPKWLYSFAVEGGYTEVGYGIGINATFRIKGLDIQPAIWFHDVSHGDAKMKEPGDPEYERELVINNMRLIMITADFLNSVRILSWLYFFYGAGVGIGIPVTRIERWELTSSGDTCTAARPGEEWCDEGGSYGENDPWPVYPYLNILVGLRFKPIPHFVANFDFGIGTGFILGMRASYIF
jgi:hypothetical protein